MQVMVPEHVAGDLRKDLKAIDPAMDLLTVSVDGACSDDPAGVEVLLRFFLNDHFPGDVFKGEVLGPLLRRMPELRWFHNGHTGMDGLMIPELLERGIVITNGAGAHKVAIAETVLAFMLADAKDLGPHLDDQRARVWRHRPHRTLRGQTVAILGLGRIGLEVARLCGAHGMRVIGTRRSDSREALPCVDEVFPANHLHECLAKADYVVVAASLTPETRGLLDRTAFAAMRETALLINVARGAIVHEDALADALRAGAIRGACLDVFETEPLPLDSRLFDLPNLVITPHNAGWTSRASEECLEIFVENFRRYRNGQTLVNLVNRSAGY